MSKTSNKQRHVQLLEWLPTLKSVRKKMSRNKPASGKRFSKFDHYKKTRERYGSKESN